jgi:hypothetical protein
MFSRWKVVLRLASGDALHSDVEKSEASATGIVPGAILKPQVVLLVSSRFSGCQRTAANLFFFSSSFLSK